MSEEQTFSVNIPSSRKNVALVESFLNSIPEFRQLEQRKYYDALIAVTEAVNNAIVHGNKCDELKQVELRVRITADVLVISVKDTGTGFEPDLVPDPRKRENILKDGGRGVFLIRSLVDEASYNNTGDGMIVELTIKLP